MEDIIVAVTLIGLAIVIILFWPALIGNSSRIRAWFDRMFRRSADDQEVASGNRRRPTRS